MDFLGPQGVHVHLQSGLHAILYRTKGVITSNSAGCIQSATRAAADPVAAINFNAVSDNNLAAHRTRL